jgi:hypothetical protein
MSDACIQHATLGSSAFRFRTGSEMYKKIDSRGLAAVHAYTGRLGASHEVANQPMLQRLDAMVGIVIS